MPAGYFRNYIANPFDAPGISLLELLNFTTDHLQRMTAANPTLFAARIAATNTALAAVGNTATDDATKLALRKARKLAKENFLAALPKSAGKIALTVEAKFGEGSPEFVECFPQGRTAYSKTADDQIATLLQTLLNGLSNHQAALGTQVLTDAGALLSGWMAVYTPSETASGAKSTTQAAKNSARAALQLELFKNLLTIALNFAGHPEQLDVYMQQSLLEDHPAAASPTPAPVPTPPGP
jgi:hypothetical protein